MKKLMLVFCLILCGCGGGPTIGAPVTQPPVVDPLKQTFTSISINASTQFVLPSNTLQFTATALDQTGKPMATQPSFSWFSNVPSVATISGKGLVKCFALGYSGIFATSGKIASAPPAVPSR